MQVISRFLITSLYVLIYVNFMFGQSCTECRFIAPVFDSVTVTTVKFGEGMNINGQLQELFMDIYQPFGDNMTKRPVVIFAFGGGFVQGSRDDWYVVEVCRHLARAGYVAVSPDYRTGIDYSEIFQLRHMRIFFRPMQDMRAAVQYLKADYSELGDNFRIDTNRIIIGGASAGAITALMVSYCDKPSEIAQMGNINALDALGGFYSTTGLYPQYSWRHAAVLNVAGALIDADWVEPGDVPHIAAHGDADQVVPYGAGSFSSLTAGLFNLEGSYVIDSIARARGVCSYLFTMEGQDHPSESMGIPYIMSVVYQLMLRMHAIANYRTFCCPLDLQLQPSDTARYNANYPDITIHSTLSNDNGNAQIQWCALPCNFSSAGASVQFTPDSSWKHIAAFAYENNCQDVALVTLKEDENYSSVASINSASYHSCLIFPQPARNWFYIRLNAAAQEYIHAEIHDLSGKVIMTFYEFCNDEGLVKLHIPSLHTGIYYVKIADEQGSYQPKKLMVIN